MQNDSFSMRQEMQQLFDDGLEVKDVFPRYPKPLVKFGKIILVSQLEKVIFTSAQNFNHLFEFKKTMFSPKWATFAINLCGNMGSSRFNT